MPGQINVNSYDGKTGILLNTQQATVNTFDQEIQANLSTHLAQVEAWIIANPAGAILTAAQTLWVAQTLAGLIRLIINQYSTIGQAN